MGVEILHRSPRLNQPGGSFLSHTGDTGNVVRAVPHKRFQVDEGQRCKAVLLLKPLRRKEDGLLIGSKAHGDVLPHQLQAVPISREDVAGRMLRRTGSRQRAEDVVRLIALTGHHLHAQQREQLFDIGQLHGKLLRHTLAVRLVGGDCLVPKRRLAQVKGNGDGVRLCLRHLFQIDIHKAKDCIGIDPSGIAEGSYAIERTVQNAVSVNGK